MQFFSKSEGTCPHVHPVIDAHEVSADWNEENSEMTEASKERSASNGTDLEDLRRGLARESTVGFNRPGRMDVQAAMNRRAQLVK